jgi:hypothetical protein
MISKVINLCAMRVVSAQLGNLVVNLHPFER